MSQRRSLSADVSLIAVLALVASPVNAQSSAKVEPVTYPYGLVPRDAIRGHLMEGVFREPCSASFDAQARELVVADSKNSLIGIFDEKGLPLFAFGGPEVLADPKQVDVAADGSIAVLDGDHSEIKVFNYRGEPKPSIRFTYLADDKTTKVGTHINAFARDKQGKWYIGDADSPQILVYSNAGVFEFGIRNENGGASFQLITGIAVADDGKIAVSDHKGTPVQVFDSKGRFISGFGKRDIAREDFAAPVSIAFDEDDYIYVVDMLRHDVKIFDVAGRFQDTFGGWFGPEGGGRAPGEMLYPCAITIAPKGPVYVVERFGQRVQIFERVKKSELDAIPKQLVPKPGVR